MSEHGRRREIHARHGAVACTRQRSQIEEPDFEKNLTIGAVELCIDQNRGSIDRLNRLVLRRRDDQRDAQGDLATEIVVDGEMHIVVFEKRPRRVIELMADEHDAVAQACLSQGSGNPLIAA